MTVTWLAVEPLDTIMVRDGRSFNAGVASRAQGTAPPPSTIGGVVRSAVGRDVTRILGPVVTTAQGLPVFPVPQDIVRDERVVRRLAVRDRAVVEGSFTVVSDLDATQRLSHTLVGDGTPETCWISKKGLIDWLTAKRPTQPGQNLDTEWATNHLKRDPVWLPEPRLGLARRWDGERVGTATPGMLYTMAHLRPRDGVRLLVACVDAVPVEVTQDVVKLGGRGRCAQVSVVPGISDASVFPVAPTDFPGGRVAVYLATPALLKNVLWHPPNAELCALALAGPQPIATASERLGVAASRQLVWAAPAGTVYYLKFDTEDDAATWAREYHGQLLPGAADLRMVTAGFGTCLVGRW